VDPSLQKVLRELDAGTLSLASATERIAALLDRAAQPQQYAQQLRDEIAQAKLEPTVAHGLASVLGKYPTHTAQRAVPEAAPASDETQLRESLTQVRNDADETRLRPDTPTSALGTPSDQDATRRDSLGATARATGGSTGSNSQPAPYTKTLTDETPAPSAYAPTLKSNDETEVIANRLARSFEETQELRTEDLRPGSVVKKRFVLDTLLGRGGMGLVFGAIDRRKEEAADPNPRVALKVLNADFQRHPQSFMALQREARKAQSLAHPNVVTVFDFDRDGSVVYMTMELLKGRPLEAMVKEARGKGVSREAALPVIRGIAEGLAYAHRKNIVHSDLKPGNIFLTADGTPKILDFGIARAVPSGGEEAEPQDIFDAGSLGAYTEAYATDEMVEGIDPHPADDMYSLGIIAYELLTGSHPYQRHSAPGARSLGIKYPSLKGLRIREARAIERCLSFDRRTRPQNAGEFLKSFRGVTRLQKASLAAVAMLAVASGVLWYQNRVEVGPAIPFDELPLTVQSDFNAAMAEGNEAWRFWVNQHIEDGLASSLRYFSTAYALHPRNREAVKVLQMAGDAQLGLAKDVPQRHEVACNLQRVSDYYRRYQPVLKAIEEGELECPPAPND
jgi:serine/threonine protein kinase